MHFTTLTNIESLYSIYLLLSQTFNLVQYICTQLDNKILTVLANDYTMIQDNNVHKTLLKCHQKRTKIKYHDEE